MSQPAYNASISAQALLQVEQLVLAYGGIQAVKGVDLQVFPGELVSLIGSNGAGKTTTLKAITGGMRAQAGRIRYQGSDIAGLGAWDLVRQGLCMVPEGRGIFGRMTILENLQMGAYIRDGSAQIQADIDRIFTTFPRLKERRSQLAGTLSGGEQQMLAMGRALMAQPQLLLLDEPSMGLSPLMVDKIFEVIHGVAAQGHPFLGNRRLAHGLERVGSVRAMELVEQLAASPTDVGSKQLADLAAYVSSVLGRRGNAQRRELSDHRIEQARAGICLPHLEP
jgi:branched-chain amino acid transport system ATP-binding protein